MKKAALYVHFPFCISKCAYCDFFSVAKKFDFEIYAECLFREAKLRKIQFGIDEIFSIYFGGGTPSILPPKTLKKILEGFFNIFNVRDDAEITIETNPDDFSDEFCDFLANSKFNRISVGIQSMNEKSVAAVGRRASVEQNEVALKKSEILQAKGKKISFDMISGLPYENETSLIAGLSRLCATKANHISLYSLTLADGTSLARAIENKSLPYDSDFSDFLWIRGRDFLISNGFSHYEVSNFAKNGEKSRHNCAYWNCEDYLGLGAGACGTFWNFSKSGVRYENLRDIEFWEKIVLRANSPNDLQSCCETEILAEKTQRDEFLMLGFRKAEGVSADDFFEKFGESLTQRIEPIFSDWQKKNLAVENKKNFALTEEGMLFLNDFLCAII